MFLFFDIILVDCKQFIPGLNLGTTSNQGNGEMVDATYLKSIDFYCYECYCHTINIFIQLTMKKVMKKILRFKVIFEKIDNAENKKVLYELFKAVKDSKTVRQLYH